MELAKRIHQINLEKGFYDPPASRARRWMLIASELFEAIEGLRENNINPSLDSDPQIIKTSVACEMADAYIRVLDFMEYEGVEESLWQLARAQHEDPAEEIFDISTVIHLFKDKPEDVANIIKGFIERFCIKHKIDLMAFVEWKLACNSKREYKHGKEW